MDNLFNNSHVLAWLAYFAENTDVDENTKDILIESAIFDAVSIRNTAARLNLKSEASIRYGKGLSFEYTDRAIERACYLLEKYADAEFVGSVETGVNKLEPIEITLRYAQIKRLLGCEIETGKCLNILENLGFEKEFLHRKIPYKVVGSLKFYEREEIKDTLAYIALCANPRDEISFRRVINKPARGIGEKKQDSIMEKAVSPTGEFTNLIDAVKELSSSFPKAAKEGATNFVKNFEELSTFFDDAEGLNLSSFIRKIINLFSLEEFYKASDEIEGTQRVANLDELVNSAAVYECSKQGLVEFLDAINLDRSLDVENENVPDDSVTLITVHNTKGLEFNKVIITGMEEGVFPRIEKVGAELEEERRLFYVGITRAKNDLFITSTSQRVMYGSWQFMRPSPFIKEARDAFKVIGQAPFGFAGGSGYRSFGAESGFGNKSTNPLAEKWCKGAKIYHDDYGYGVIVSARDNGGEYVIEIQFENGARKKFLPQYQAKSLTLIKL